MSLRILAMVHLFPPRHCAGAEMMLVSMLRPLVERGHDVHVLLSRDTADSEPYDYRGMTVHPRWTAEPHAEVQAADVVVTHLENYPRATVLGRMYRRPVVHVIHNTHDITAARVAEGSGLVVFNSQWTADELPTDSETLIIRPPVFAEDYRTTPGDKVTLVNLNADKGGELFGRLAARMPDVPFLAVEGAYGEQLVPDLPNVEHRGHGGDMRAVYGSTRILLMPSVYESWGRVGVEAMCSGIPVIAHSTPGLRESLGEAGIFADRDDDAAWEQAIRRLLDGRHWNAASRLVRRRAGELDPGEDLARWCDAIEDLARR